MIRSFRCKETQAVFEGRRSETLQGIVYAAETKLAMLNAAQQLSDLARFPGNRREMLQGGRAGLHCIRVNDRIRLVFRWRDGEAYDVEIVDYH